MKKPKISVLTPVYNTKPDALRAMIDSILSQTFTDFEFLILNDSPNNTELENIVMSYTDKRIRYMKNDCNMGITKSRNKLIDLARGEYLAIADHDDISMPDRLKLESDFLDNNPHIGAVGGNVIEIKNGKEYPTAQRPIHDHDIKLSLINDTYVCNPVHSGCMIRKSVLDTSGVRYTEKFSPCEDRMLFIDLIPHTFFHNLPDVVLKYLWDGNNTTIRQWQKMYDLPPTIVAYAREKYPIYYDEWKQLQQYKPVRKTKTIKILGFMPIITIKAYGKCTKIYLFNKIQIIRINHKSM